MRSYFYKAPSGLLGWLAGLFFFSWSLLGAVDVAAEKLYFDYLRSKDLSPIQNQLAKAQGETLKRWLQFLAEKKNPAVNAWVMQAMQERNELFLLYQTYFSASLRDHYLPRFTPLYYQLLLSLRLEEELFQIVLQRLAGGGAAASADQSAGFQVEQQFLKQLLSQTKQKQKLLGWLQGESAPFTAAEKVVLMQVVHFYLQDWKTLYHSLKGSLLPRPQGVSNTALPAFAQRPSFSNFYQTLKLELLRHLFAEGHYEAFLSLGPVFPGFYSQFSSQINEALFLGRLPVAQFSTPGAPPLGSLPALKQAFSSGRFDVFLQRLTPALEQQFPLLRRWHFLTLAHLGRWTQYDALLATLAPAEQSFYLWVKLFFSAGVQTVSEATAALPAELMDAFQLQFLAFKQTETNLSLLQQTMQRLLLQESTLYDFLLEKKNEFSAGFFEFAVAEVARFAFLRGDFETVSELFRAHFSPFSYLEAKEKLMYYHGLALFFGGNKAEGEDALLKTLFLNPQTVFRFQILQALDAIF